MKEKAGALARDFAPEAATLAVLAAVFWFFMKTGMLNDRELVQPLLWHLMILICIGTLILAFCKKLTYERLISVILLAGLIMRIGFVLYKNTDAAYHDLGEIKTENAYGHAAYVLTILRRAVCRR